MLDGSISFKFSVPNNSTSKTKKENNNQSPPFGGGARKVIMIKYQCTAERGFKVQPRGVKYSCEALEVVPGEEGFWRRLDHFITRDSKCSDKIKALITKLQTMSADQKKAVEIIKMDYGVVKPSDLEYMIKFTDDVFQWMLKNLGTLKDKVSIWYNSGEVKKNVRAWAAKESEAYRKKWDITKLSNFALKRDASGKELPENMMLGQLGYKAANVQQLASKFSAGLSGHKRDVEKINSLVYAAGSDLKVGAMVMSDGSVGITFETIVSRDAQKLLDILSIGLDVYKYLDYFFFYLSKEI